MATNWYQTVKRANIDVITAEIDEVLALGRRPITVVSGSIAI